MNQVFRKKINLCWVKHLAIIFVFELFLMSTNTTRHGDTAWLLTSTGLVYMMTPALACFYGGLVESKNFLNQLFLSVVCMAIIPVQWCLFGYSFAFGPGNAFFGSFDYSVQRKAAFIAIEGENVDSHNPMSVPTLAFVAYQCSFAIITPALISGAVVGRMKLVPYMIFIFLWATFCYDPLARWIFYNHGWLNDYAIMDFAGGLVVHMSSGISGLVAALILGARANFDPDVLHAGQTNLPFTILGTGLLWVGWMGFNGGSGLSADGTAALAIVNTNVAAAGSMVIWMILDIAVAKIRHQNSFYVSIPGLCSATVVGLVVVTPGAGYVQPGYALLMGVIGGIVIYMFLSGKKRFFHIDDTLDVFSCHGIGGFLGTILTGFFAQTSVNANAINGAFYGYPMQICYQLLGAVITTAYSAACTAAILLPMHFTIGIRIPRLDQVRGLDNVAHGVMEAEIPVKIQPGAKISNIVKQRKESYGIATIQLDR